MQDELAGAAQATDPGKRMFVTLEGLRGVAAVAVMIFHFHESSPLPSAYLAVDMFFLLSGFVIANRYLSRFGTSLSFGRFVLARLVRLYPLYALGSAFTASVWLAGFLFGSGHHDWALLTNFIASAALMLPAPYGSPFLFPLNVPAWSLFFELLANALFAWLAPRRFRALVPLIAIGVAGLVLAAVLNGHLDLGATRDTPHWGAARVVASFFLGVLIFQLYESNRLPAIRLPAVLLPLAFLLVTLIPYSGALPAVLDCVAVLVAFPLILIAGVQTEPRGMVAWGMKWLGLLSFPLYAVHGFLLAMAEKGALRFHLPIDALRWLCVPVALVLAYLSLRWFDEPVRRWLVSKLLHRKTAA